MSAKPLRKHAFTLVEIIVVVVILGILAAVAIPKVVGPSEQIKASEGVRILTALLGAQLSYFQDNNAYAVSANISNSNPLDVTIPASTNFASASLANDSTQVATIARSGGPVYSLRINTAGIVRCTGAGCAQAKCNKGGGANQCNL